MPSTSQDDVEAAHAASLLAEVLIGTPRGRSAAAAADSKKDLLPPALQPQPVRPNSTREGEGGRAPASEQYGDDEEEAWVVESLRARRRIKGEMNDGVPGEWQYLVRWQGRGEEDDCWVPESMLDPDFVAADLEAAATERAMSARAPAVTGA
jgi:hypothetical protein